MYQLKAISTIVAILALSVPGHSRPKDSNNLAQVKSATDISLGDTGSVSGIDEGNLLGDALSGADSLSGSVSDVASLTGLLPEILGNVDLLDALIGTDGLLPGLLGQDSLGDVDGYGSSLVNLLGEGDSLVNLLGEDGSLVNLLGEDGSLANIQLGNLLGDAQSGAEGLSVSVLEDTILLGNLLPEILGNEDLSVLLETGGLLPGVLVKASLGGVEGDEGSSVPLLGGDGLLSGIQLGYLLGNAQSKADSVSGDVLENTVSSSTPTEEGSILNRILAASPIRALLRLRPRLG